jgi:hypothetical protein
MHRENNHTAYAISSSFSSIFSPLLRCNSEIYAFNSSYSTLLSIHIVIVVNNYCSKKYFHSHRIKYRELQSIALSNIHPIQHTNYFFHFDILQT